MRNLATTILPVGGQPDAGIVLNNSTKELAETQLLVRADMNPTKGFPNIQDSFVELKTENKILKKHGLKRREESRLHLKTGSNRHLNKYINYLVSRLNHYVDIGDSKSFWKLAILIGERSSVWKALMLHEVQPHWHRSISYKHLYLLISKTTDFWKTKPYEIKYKRVYIPKKTDPVTGEVLKYRPLGVPTLPWRIYLHGWQFFLMIFLKNRISAHQHGFYKGRGTVTAWEEVISSANNYENI
jgi:hypothetical protein